MRIPFKSLLAFVLLFGLMYAALSQSWNHGVSRWVIDIGTVEPAAWTARLLTGDAGIVAAGSQLRSPQGSINVLFGCEGSDVWMMLAAALLASPVAWRCRLVGVIAGTAFVFVLNQARVLALFFAIRLHSAWFGTLHGLVAPLAVVVLVTAFFLLWLHWSVRFEVDRRTSA